MEVAVEQPSLASLGIWQLLDVRHTCVFPPGEEPDPFLVKEIRGFEPRFVPVYSNWEYRLPTGSKHVQPYHLIAKHVTDVYDAEEDLGEPLKIEAFPPGFLFTAGPIYGQMKWSVPWPKHSRELRLNLPDMPMTFNRELVEYMREVHHFLVRTPGSLKSKVMAALMRDQEREQRFLKQIEDDTLGKLRERLRSPFGGEAQQRKNRVSISIRVRPNAGSEGK